MKKKYLLLTALTLSAFAATAQTPVFANEATVDAEEVQTMNRVEDRTVVSRYLDTNGNRIIEDVMGDGGKKEIPGYTFKSFAAGVDKGEDGNFFGVYFYTYEKVEEATTPEDKGTTPTDTIEESREVSRYMDTNGNRIIEDIQGNAGQKEFLGYVFKSFGAGVQHTEDGTVLRVYNHVYEKVDEATTPEDKGSTSTEAKDQAKPADQAPESKFLPQGEGPKNAPWGWGTEFVGDRSELVAKAEKAAVSANSAKATNSVKTLPETGTKSDNLTLAAGAVGLLGTLTLVQSRRKKGTN